MNVTNRFEVVNCQACGRRVARKSRQQRYCSDRCREYEKGQRRVRKSFLSNRYQSVPEPPLFVESKQWPARSKIGVEHPAKHPWRPSLIPVDRDVLRKVVRAELGST